MNQGFMKLIIIMILLIVILSMLGVNLASLINNKTLQENFSFTWNWTKYVWNEYLQEPAGYLWGIFVENVWEPSLDTLKGFREKNPPPPYQ
ncbi:hypothetical protein ACFL3E_01195 [Patescibacteria group bacterium]